MLDVNMFLWPAVERIANFRDRPLFTLLGGAEDLLRNAIQALPIFSETAPDCALPQLTFSGIDVASRCSHCFNVNALLSLALLALIRRYELFGNVLGNTESGLTVCGGFHRPMLLCGLTRHLRPPVLRACHR